jgi:ABC-2 type transport system ATP-binding protein
MAVRAGGILVPENPSAQLMPVKVSVRDLRKRYGAVEAARGVSFEVGDGEIFGLIGPNGAGKTTTVECVIGLREPDSGSIEVCGIDARQHPRQVKQRIGAALQSTALQDTITPREALTLFGSLYRSSVAPTALLERFAIGDKADAPFETLSGGQRQRLALALAFVNDPELVFLDEPTAGLDPHSRRELHADIKRIKRDGRTVLLTTHYLDEAEQLCDRVAVIHGGRIVTEGAPRALIAASKAPSVVAITFDRPVDPAIVARVPGVEEVLCDGMTIRFRAPDLTRALAGVMTRLAADGVQTVDLHVRKATLEEVFLELTAPPR